MRVPVTHDFGQNVAFVCLLASCHPFLSDLQMDYRQLSYGWNVFGIRQLVRLKVSNSRFKAARGRDSDVCLERIFAWGHPTSSPPPR